MKTEDRDHLVRALKGDAPVSDQRFDELFAAKYRTHSERHFTPIDFCKKAARFLSAREDAKILDVGSGTGKFCAIGSLISKAHFTGVEHRKDLVKLSKSMSKELSLERVSFICADIRTIDLSVFNGFYFYNPFVENIYEPDMRMEESLEQPVEHSEIIFESLLDWVETQLTQMPAGTRVVTFHGMGRELPASYELIDEVVGHGGSLQFYMQS